MHPKLRAWLLVVRAPAAEVYPRSCRAGVTGLVTDFGNVAFIPLNRVSSATIIARCRIRTIAILRLGTPL